MAKLPEEIKSKWVAALRSGNYQQATGELNSGTGFCCLGVLAEVLEPGVTGPEGELYGMCTLKVPNSSFSKQHDLYALYEYNAELEKLTEIRQDGQYRQIDDCLMSLNDDSGWSFEQIAEVVEKYL